MHLIEKNTVRICLRLLNDELDHLIRAQVKVKDKKGNFIAKPARDISAAIRDITRYEAMIDFMKESTEHLFYEE